MEREWLASELERGRSIESLARELGRSPSTVWYWVRKYGLRSRHAERHAPRGGIDQARLRRLAADGLSGRAIADELGVSQTSVRYWMGRLGLRTRRARRPSIAEGLEHPHAERESPGHCTTHGRTVFRRGSSGRWRCARCASAQVSSRRRAVKAALVREAGGACQVCGYDRFVGALQFHHVDPAEKAFALSFAGATLAIDRLRAEAAKCVLLCANCHAEVEAGLARLPPVVRLERATHVPG